MKKTTKEEAIAILTGAIAQIYPFLEHQSLIKRRDIGYVVGNLARQAATRYKYIKNNSGTETHLESGRPSSHYESKSLFVRVRCFKDEKEMFTTYEDNVKVGNLSEAVDEALDCLDEHGILNITPELDETKLDAAMTRQHGNLYGNRSATTTVSVSSLYKGYQLIVHIQFARVPDVERLEGKEDSSVDVLEKMRTKRGEKGGKAGK